MEILNYWALYYWIYEKLRSGIKISQLKVEGEALSAARYFSKYIRKNQKQ
jgi:hypothetical protein